MNKVVIGSVCLMSIIATLRSDQSAAQTVPGIERLDSNPIIISFASVLRRSNKNVRWKRGNGRLPFRIQAFECPLIDPVV